MKHTSFIELNSKALKRNIKYLKKRIGENTVFVSVIKGNAYGHGIEEFLPLAEKCSVHYFAVFDAHEASRALAIKKPETKLMIMGMIDNEDLSWAIENDISFYVFELDRLEHTIKSAKKLNKTATIHIEIETGFNRTGFEKEELEKVVQLIHKNAKFIEVEGLCTHYAGAESVANYRRIIKQLKRFNEISQWLATRNIKAKYHHTAGSAAALTYPETIMDMVRFGIAQYGFWPSKETKIYNLLSDDTTFTVNPLQRVLTWKSKVMSIKHIKRGEFVNYSNLYLASKDMTVASIPIGYSHGFSRSLSNLGNVLIKGKKAPVIGFVNMNMFLVNVSHIPEIKKGDEVVLIGTQGKQTISVASFSELSNYLNYELLTSLPSNIPKIIKNC